MHILFLVSSLQTGGAERVAAVLANQWVRQGHRVTLMPTYSNRGRVDFALDPAIELTFLADITACGMGIAAFGRYRALRRYIRASRPDIVLSFLTNVNIAAILARSAAPLVVAERTYPPGLPTARWLNVLRRLTYGRADMVVMQTRAGLDWLSRAIPGARGTVMRNPVALPLGNAAPAPDPLAFAGPAEQLIVGVGRLDSLKNFELLIRAFAIHAAGHPASKLAILGEGPQLETLRRLARELGLADRVILPGRAGNLDAWYRRADGFVSTSLLEGFPNALLEAMAYGVPVVALDCLTGPAELIDSDATGILLPLAAGATRVAVAIDRLLSRDWPEIRDRVPLMIKSYSVAAVAGDWIALFDDLRNKH